MGSIRRAVRRRSRRQLACRRPPGRRAPWAEPIVIESQDARIASSSAGVERRTFIAWTAGAAAVGVLAAVGGTLVRAGSTAVTAVRQAIKLPAPAVAAPPIPAGGRARASRTRIRRHSERVVLPDRHRAHRAAGRSGRLEPADPRHGRGRGRRSRGTSCSLCRSKRASRRSPASRTRSAATSSAMRCGSAIRSASCWPGRSPRRMPTWCSHGRSTGSRHPPPSKCSRTTAMRSSPSA